MTNLTLPTLATKLLQTFRTKQNRLQEHWPRSSSCDNESDMLFPLAVRPDDLLQSEPLLNDSVADGSLFRGTRCSSVPLRTTSTNYTKSKTFHITQQCQTVTTHRETGYKSWFRLDFLYLLHGTLYILYSLSANYHTFNLTVCRNAEKLNVWQNANCIINLTFINWCHLLPPVAVGLPWGADTLPV